jgi:uncharacterized protein (DUF2267 family)
MQRRIARAEATYRRLLNEVRAETGVGSAEEADTVLEIVLSSLVRRLTPGEAKDLISQLPSLLHPMLLALPPGPDMSISRESIEAELARDLGVEPAHAAQLLKAAGATITRNISEGQMDDVRRQLQRDLREVFSAPAPSARSASAE